MRRFRHCSPVGPGDQISPRSTARVMHCGHATTVSQRIGVEMSRTAQQAVKADGEGWTRVGATIFSLDRHSNGWLSAAQMKATRTYTMGSRADAVVATRDRIAEAAKALFFEHAY